MADAIVHTVPGPWASRNDFIAALPSATADQTVLAAGPMMHKVGSDTHSEWAWAPPDPTLADRFALTLRRFPDVDAPLNAVNDHASSDTGGFYSSGMTQFGLPDTFVETPSFDEAVETARQFERYQLLECPNLADGHTFSITADAPVWILFQKPHPSGNSGEIDRSPGMWVLRKGGRG